VIEQAYVKATVLDIKLYNSVNMKKKRLRENLLTSLTFPGVRLAS